MAFVQLARNLYPEKVNVLAILTNGLVDREMSVEAARQLWADLCSQGWRRATEQELNASRMSHRRLQAAYDLGALGPGFAPP